ncbi:MAG TPA: VOC family protein [Thermoanaerobaculia bacterium]|jgi:catechol 2,3-dioxygenase-like lactoylglutathione lyase family enzyme|nr:VOC family protein [Thermoanaerobaculia bacterium]
MEIRQFRVVVRTSNYDRAMKFYGESLALPKLQSWDNEDMRVVLFQAGSAVVEIQGPPASQDPRLTDERFRPQGPLTKTKIVFIVPSAQQAYDEIYFREKNIPGGLRKDDDGALMFETHDPDGIRVAFKEPAGT